ncbi:MAG TPA: hypothetical protein VFE05_03640 [Longimicrobiaceae bacterium]|jgi:hypothetical protein|nr:hypothetical protein [Longimicrobiaceae bacterium]
MTMMMLEMSGQAAQSLAAGGIVLAAAAYVGSKWRRTLLSARGGKKDGPGCGSDCGCGK